MATVRHVCGILIFIASLGAFAGNVAEEAERVLGTPERRGQDVYSGDLKKFQTHGTPSQYPNMPDLVPPPIPPRQVEKKVELVPQPVEQTVSGPKFIIPASDSEAEAVRPKKEIPPTAVVVQKIAERIPAATPKPTPKPTPIATPASVAKEHSKLRVCGFVPSQADTKFDTRTIKKEKLIETAPKVYDQVVKLLENDPGRRKIVWAVKEGLSLQEISMRVFGTTQRWREIYILNHDNLKSYDGVPLGKKLTVYEFIQPPCVP